MAIRVLIIDDSALMRRMLGELLASDSEIEVVGTAVDPLDAREKIKQLQPDVVTLDIEMPRMDGLTFLEKLMTLRPMPVLMISSLTQEGAEATLRALELGAVDYVSKPVKDPHRGLPDMRDEIVAKVKAAARARIRILAPPRRHAHRGGGDWLVAVGASTGGVEALHEIIQALPAQAPPMMVVQHMPEKFTGTFAQRLDRASAVTVVEAEEGMVIRPGQVIIAAGHSHLRVEKKATGLVCRLGQDDKVSGHRPSVDVLFESVAEQVGANAVGIILTGMGRDGVQGLLKMRHAGAPTMGQDEGSCVVYGMPKAARLAGAVARELPLNRMAEFALKGPADLRAAGIV